MELLNAIIETKSEDDILNAYNELISLNRVSEANLLRAKFIRSKALRPEKLVWTPVLKELFNIEKDYILNVTVTPAILETANEWEFNKELSELSRLNAFLYTHLYKEIGTIENADNRNEILKVSARENYFISPHSTKRYVTDFLTKLYIGLEWSIEMSRSRLVIHFINNYALLNELLGEFNYFQDFDSYGFDRKMDAALQEYLADPDEHILQKESIVFGLIFGYGCCLSSKDMLSAKYFLIKALSLMDKSDFLYDILVFLEKEID